MYDRGKRCVPVGRMGAKASAPAKVWGECALVCQVCMFRIGSELRGGGGVHVACVQVCVRGIDNCEIRKYL